MMKMAWGLLANTEDLWARIIRGKYMPHDTNPKVQGIGQKSRLWHGICKTWDIMKEGICWVLGDGRRVRFWLDPWLDVLGPLLKYAIGEIHDNLIQMWVCDFVDGNGQWAWTSFRFFYP